MYSYNQYILDYVDGSEEGDLKPLDEILGVVASEKLNDKYVTIVRNTVGNVVAIIYKGEEYRSVLP